MPLESGFMVPDAQHSSGALQQSNVNIDQLSAGLRDLNESGISFVNKFAMEIVKIHAFNGLGKRTIQTFVNIGCF